ncbi:fimbrial protein, partial [Salmonella enterica subsp. salamae]|nr:fimbrial protein [Salmonella enterica subsp. salamae]
MKKIALLICLLFVEEGHAAVQRTIFRADVVASACHVSVNADGAGGSRLT